MEKIRQKLKSFTELVSEHKLVAALIAAALIVVIATTTTLAILNTSEPTTTQPTVTQNTEEYKSASSEETATGDQNTQGTTTGSTPRQNTAPQPPSQPATSPCTGSGETAQSLTCTRSATGAYVDIFGVPSAQSGPYGKTLAANVTVKCSAANSCSFNGAAFTEKTFTSGDFTGNQSQDGTYTGNIRVQTAQPTQITVTVQKTIATAYKQPFCNGCSTQYTDHVFNFWGVEDRTQDGYLRMVANYTSTVRQ